MSEVSVITELERIGWSFDFAGEDEISVICPFHNDNSPSCSINVQSRLFKCQTAGCDASGDFISFLARALRTTRSAVIADLGTRYTIDSTKSIDVATIERYHDAIWSNKLFLGELHSRGVTDELIRKYRLGTYRSRITIPVANESGTYVNVRRYLPGAPGKEKMRNTKGRGKARLYPIEQLKYQSIVICAGEMKAVVAAHQLNRHGIGAICATCGEGNWEPSFNIAFKGKAVYVIYDIDEEGQKGAITVLTYMYRSADSIHNITLPLDIDKYPHGDINDYCGPAENKKLHPLIKSAEEWKPSYNSTDDYDKEPKDVELNEATNARSANVRIRFTAVASAAHEASYSIPKSIRCACSKDQTECSICPVFLEANDALFYIPKESEAILEMVASTKGAQRESIMSGIGIPATCKVCSFEACSYYNVEDVRLSPRLEISSRTTEKTMQPAMCIGDQIELNDTYEFIGRMHPHPKTQQSTLLVSEYKHTKDALSSYILEEPETLSIFQPDYWSIKGLTMRLDAIYMDLSANVTRIMQRQSLHLSVDLAYHSPLFIPFDGKVIKGWTEILVLGDSSQGKSDTAIGLMQHYGLGEKVECKNATVAGLLGGLQSMGGRWFVTWGVIPTHDQRIVILEELKGASQEVISKLTDMRSSGIAEIPKIEKRRTHARTRLLALSNSRGDRPLSSYNFGIDAVKELIGALEDIRRFDFVLLVSERDIDPDVLNKLRKNRPNVVHVYKSELCRKLILWAWTRKDNQVMFDKDATNTILEASIRLSNEFSEAIPIIDKGSTRYKIARLSASLAARTFSTDDMETLRIRKVHVDYVEMFMRTTYSSDVFGYKDFSDAIKIQNELLDPKIVRKQIKETPFAADFIKQILHTNYIELQDIQDWCSWDRRDSQNLLSVLVRKHALVRTRRCYRKTPAFIELLKSMLDTEDLPDRPDFIGEEF